MKTLLLLSILASAPVFAASGSASGSYPPSYFHQDSPDSGRDKAIQNTVAHPQYPQPTELEPQN
jgi:hypothetical protein